MPNNCGSGTTIAKVHFDVMLSFVNFCEKYDLHHRL